MYSTLDYLIESKKEQNVRLDRIQDELIEISNKISDLFNDVNKLREKNNGEIC